MLDLTSRVLAELPGVTLAELPRMAEFARVLAALDVVCGWATVPDYTTAVKDASRAVLDSDPIVEAIYSHVLPTMQDDAAERMDGALGEFYLRFLRRRDRFQAAGLRRALAMQSSMARWIGGRPRAVSSWVVA